MKHWTVSGCDQSPNEKSDHVIKKGKLFRPWQEDRIYLRTWRKQSRRC